MTKNPVAPRLRVAPAVMSASNTFRIGPTSTAHGPPFLVGAEAPRLRTGAWSQPRALSLQTRRWPGVGQALGVGARPAGTPDQRLGNTCPTPEQRRGVRHAGNRPRRFPAQRLTNT